MQKVRKKKNWEPPKHLYYSQKQVQTSAHDYQQEFLFQRLLFQFLFTASEDCILNDPALSETVPYAMPYWFLPALSMFQREWKSPLRRPTSQLGDAAFKIKDGSYSLTQSSKRIIWISLIILITFWCGNYIHFWVFWIIFFDGHVHGLS